MTLHDSGRASLRASRVPLPVRTEPRPPGYFTAIFRTKGSGADLAIRLLTSLFDLAIRLLTPLFRICQQIQAFPG
jgi:hypothetical protein